jgi:exosome complex RNA-binding protein Rrp4
MKLSINDSETNTTSASQDISDSKLYLQKRINEIKKEQIEENNIPFKITEIREKGFIINVSGLKGFISFNHMPWEYSPNNNWHLLYPYIRGKYFFGKVYQINQIQQTVVIDGKVPQFKKSDFIEDNKYRGIILDKTDSGLWVDIGYHFQWECGSIVTKIRRFSFESAQSCFSKKTGEVIEVFFWGHDDNANLLFGYDNFKKIWYTGEIYEYIGKSFPVNIVKTKETGISFLVENKYKATLNNITRKNKKAFDNLIDGDIIHCEIVNVNNTKKLLRLNWEYELEIEEIAQRNSKPNKKKTILTENSIIQNKVNQDVVKILKLIGKIVKVEVIQKEDSSGRIFNTYFVENKYKGKLNISNDNYQITKVEKKHIEENLQDGDIIDCEVLNVQKKTMRIKWNLLDEELQRFLQ